MNQPRTPEQANDRLEAKARTPEDKLPTYQELLDGAVEDTFPASDPVATSVGRHVGQPVSTGMDDKDWKLEPASARQGRRNEEVVAEFDDEAAARQAQDHALAVDMPTARLELPPENQRDGPAATVTVVACGQDQRERAVEIVREAGAAHVEVKR
jgi:hypothetical protein